MLLTDNLNRFLRDIFVVAICIITVFATFPASASLRIALVIGNSDYDTVPRLANPLHDSADMEATLTRIGFDVTRLNDADYETTRRALARFGSQAARADVAVIYFAGHGIEVDRRNYLIPVDARLDTPRDLVFYGTPLTLLRQAVRPARQLGLVIVDACRDNPFLEQMATSTRSLSRGLARIEASGQNELVAFSAKAGTVAQDGEGRNSPYAAALGDALQTPGLEIGKLFRRVRDRVLTDTRGLQEPALYGSLSEADFFFVEEEAQQPTSLSTVTPSTKSTVTPPQAPQAPSPAVQTVDMAFWNAISSSADPRDFEEYLRRFPDGIFAGIADRRLEALLTGEQLAAVSPRPAPQAPQAAKDPITITPSQAPESEPEAETSSPAVTLLAKPPDPPVEEALDAPPLAKEEELAALTPAPSSTPPPEDAAPVPELEADVEPFTPTRAQVRDVQARLNILGYKAGPVDGLPGRRTTNALTSYQRKIGLAPDGKFSAKVIELLRTDVSDVRLAAYYDAIEAQRQKRLQAKPVQPAVPAKSESAVVAAPAEPQETATAPATVNTRSNSFRCRVFANGYGNEGDSGGDDCTGGTGVVVNKKPAPTESTQKSSSFLCRNKSGGTGGLNEGGYSGECE